MNDPRIPNYSEYRGFTIADKSHMALMNCPFWITVPGFGPLGAPTLAEAHAKIDRIIAKRDAPAQPGELKVLAVLPHVKMHKASTTRNMAERARGQRRKTGKFA